MVRTLRRSVGGASIGTAPGETAAAVGCRERRHADVRPLAGRDGVDQETRGGDSGGGV